MNYHDSSSAQLAALLDASHDLCETLRMCSEEAEEAFELAVDGAGNADDLEVFRVRFNIAQYRYLREKFASFYFHDERLEIWLKKVRPGWKMFSPVDFELLVRCLLYLIEDKYYHTTKASNDKGVDLYWREDLTSGVDIVSSVLNIVQCKLYRGSVPVSCVRDFFGVSVANHACGYFITTGKLPKSSIEFIDMADKQFLPLNIPVLIDGERLGKLLEIGDDLVSCWDCMIDLSSLGESNSVLIDDYLRKRLDLKKRAHVLLSKPMSESPKQLNLF